MAITRIPIVRNPKYVPNGLKSYIYTLNKYSITPPKGMIVSRNAQKNLVMQKAGTTHQVTANDQQNDSFYTCPVQIGTPPQTLNLDFDSGSSDLWVWSTEITDQNALQQGEANGIQPFDPSKSSTFKKSSGSTWSITYGDQSSASGDVGTDLVKVGDITIKAQAVELAKQISAQFASTGGAGLLGLAFGTINTVKPTPVKTPVENMIAQNDIPQSAELFTVYLGSVKDQQSADKGQSFYTFGSIDQAVIPSGQQISYTPVDNSQGFWTFDSTSATVNGQTIQLSGNTAIADTGTTLMMVSSQLCEAIYAQIPGAKNDSQAGGWTFPASTATSSLPTVTVAVGDTQFTVEKEHIGWSATDSSGSTLFGGIQDRGNLGFDILGDTFLMNVYAVFDVGNTRFGCVQRADPTAAGAN